MCEICLEIMKYQNVKRQSSTYEECEVESPEEKAEEARIAGTLAGASIYHLTHLDCW